MPELKIEDLNKAVKDSAYAAVGFGVLGFQRAQVRRRELTEQLQSGGDVFGNQFTAARDQLAQLAKLIEDQVGPAREQLTTYAKKVDKQVAPVRKQVEGTLDDLESRLPASARNTFASIRQGAEVPERYVRNTFGLTGTNN